MEYKEAEKLFFDITPIISLRGTGGSRLTIGGKTLTYNQYLKLMSKCSKVSTDVEHINGTIKTTIRCICNSI